MTTTSSFARTAILLCACFLFADSSFAGQIWTDGNGDGLVDESPLIVAPGSDVIVGLWIDSQSFSWTNYLAYVEWSSDCMSYVSAAYVIAGGGNFPIDDFSHPRGVGFGGQGFDEEGVDQIANLTLRVDVPVSCCVQPIIDLDNPYFVFSQLGAGQAYFLFSDAPGTCFIDPAPVIEACCFCPSGACAEMTALDCAAAGGIPMGPGTSCENTPCDCPPIGACCLPSGDCLDAVTAADCAFFEGQFVPEVACTTLPCVTAVTSGSWGKVKILFR
jgi:hypothetical protein